MKKLKHLKLYENFETDDIINEIFVPKEDLKMYDVLTKLFGTNNGEVMTVKLRKLINRLKKQRQNI